MSTAAARARPKRNSAYVVMLVPIVGIASLLWYASHRLTKPEIGIYYVAGRGDLKAAEAHILTGTDINELSPEGHTALYYAIMGKKPEVVAYLLKHGARVDAEGSGLPSPLIPAAATGNLNLVETLVSRGADPKERMANGSSPLFSAVDSGNVALVRYLLSKGADPNAQLLNGGGTPLCSAGTKGGVELIEALLDAGANPNTTGRHRMGPLYFAVRRGADESVQLLLKKGANADVTDDVYHVQLLTLAWDSRDSEAMQWMLLRSMKNFSALDSHRGTFLHYAIRQHVDLKLIEALIQKGVPLNVVDNYGDTPLSLAVDQKDQALTQALTQAGARIPLSVLIRHELTRNHRPRD